MFDLNFGKLLLLAVLALIVLGPERLPKAARMAGVMLRRARRSWDSVRTEVERELQLEEIKRAAQETKAQAESFRTSAADMASDARGAFDDTVAEVKDFANFDVLGEKDGSADAVATADMAEETDDIAHQPAAGAEPVASVAAENTDQDPDSIPYEPVAAMKQTAYIDVDDAAERSSDDADPESENISHESAAEAKHSAYVDALDADDDAAQDADEDPGAIPYRRVGDVNVRDVKRVARVAAGDRDGHA